MNTVISVKTTTAVKEAAREVAQSMGLNLSTILNAYLRQLIATRRVELYAPEDMTPQMQAAITVAEKEIAAGEIVGPFSDTKSFLKALKTTS